MLCTGQLSCKYEFRSLTNPMEQSRETNSLSASQQIPRLLWNAEIRCRPPEPHESYPHIPALFI